MSFIIHYPDTTRSASAPSQQQHPLDMTQNDHGDGRHRPLSLTGLVGRDGQVYWLEEAAAKLFDTKALVIHHVNPPLPNVSDVAGFIPIQRVHHLLNEKQQPKQKYHREHNKQHYFRSWFLRHRVLTHAQLCQAFQNHAKTTPTTTTSSRSSSRIQDDNDDGDQIRHFGELLNDRDTHVVEGTDPINKIPALCIVIPNNNNHSEKPAIPTSSLADIKRFLMDTEQQPIPFFIWLACFKLRIQKDLYQLPSPPFNFLKKKKQNHQCRRSLSEKKKSDKVTHTAVHKK